MKVKLKNKAQLAKNNPVINGHIIVNGITINKHMLRLLGKVVEAKECGDLIIVNGWNFPNACIAKIIQPMTKAQEIKIIKKAIMDLGQESYIGPWLKKKLPYLENCLKSDYLPED